MKRKISASSIDEDTILELKRMWEPSKIQLTLDEETRKYAKMRDVVFMEALDSGHSSLATKYELLISDKDEGSWWDIEEWSFDKSKNIMFYCRFFKYPSGAINYVDHDQYNLTDEQIVEFKEKFNEMCVKYEEVDI